MAELSNAHKARFVKDFGIPIQVVREPMFSYYIQQLDPYYDVTAKLQLMQKLIDTEGVTDFFEESNRVKGKLVQAIQADPNYELLQKDRLASYDVKNGVKQQNIYNMENVGRNFVSVDLKHANFNSMRHYHPDLVLGAKTYAEMVGSVTDFDYFKKSKNLRQVIFGNLGPKKQQRIQKWIISQIIQVLHTDRGIPMEDFISASSDEIVFIIDGVLDAEQYVIELNEILSDNENTSDFIDWLRVEIFALDSIGDQKFFVKKSFLNNEVDFKAIPSTLFMQAFKHYTGGEVTDFDLMFVYDGKLAQFKETLFK